MGKATARLAGYIILQSIIKLALSFTAYNFIFLMIRLTLFFNRG